MTYRLRDMLDLLSDDAYSCLKVVENISNNWKRCRIFDITFKPVYFLDEL